LHQVGTSSLLIYMMHGHTSHRMIVLSRKLSAEIWLAWVCTKSCDLCRFYTGMAIAICFFFWISLNFIPLKLSVNI